MPCKNDCGIVYCNKLCLNRDIRLHTLNCAKNEKFPPALGCDYCWRLVEVSAVCEECRMEAVCYHCKHLHVCKTRGLDYETRKVISAEVETEPVAAIIKTGILRKEKRHVVFLVPYEDGNYNTDKMEYKTVTSEELSALTVKAPTLIRFNTLYWKKKTDIVAGLIICQKDGKSLVEIYKTIAAPRGVLDARVA